VKFLLCKSEVGIASEVLRFSQSEVKFAKSLRRKAKLHYEVTSLR
jgi:hypothetical protein